MKDKCNNHNSAITWPVVTEAKGSPYACLDSIYHLMLIQFKESSKGIAALIQRNVVLAQSCVSSVNLEMLWFLFTLRRY